MEYKKHYSVLKSECIDLLTANLDEFHEEDTIYIADLTFGAGGHSFSLLEKDPRIHLISFDQDPEALENGFKNIKKRGYEARIDLIDSNFEKFSDIVLEKFPFILEDKYKFHGVLMDLGVSSHHFDKEERGFSFRFDAKLDMRMDVDNSSIKTAQEIVNKASEEDLVSILSEYGEEKYSKRIAKNIIEKRSNSPIETTKDLENIIFHSYPKKERHGKTNPATKTFQALRIAVNKELDVLARVLGQVVPMLRMNGRVAAISFHSLEDRIVKKAFKEMVDGDLPVEILTKKPIIPSLKEIEENSRSRSAKLRVLERILERKSKNKYSKFSKVSKVTKI